VESLHDGTVVLDPSPSALARAAGWPVAEEGDGVRLMVAGGLDEGGQDLALLGSPGCAVIRTTIT
jgi:hypothetical protein